MPRAFLLLLTVSVLGCCALSAQAAPNAALERGAAIIDPFALRELDAGQLSLRRVLRPYMSVDTPLDNGELFASREMEPVRKALDPEFERYVAAHKRDVPNESIGVGTSFDWQLFDRDLLYSNRTRFVLAGIVNRMDRAYVEPASCGEIRLIYRLTRLDNTAASARLPMTLNAILRAKSNVAIGKDGKPMGCADIARRWLDVSNLSLTGSELARRLISADGPLGHTGDVERIETNLQIAHAPKSAVREFRTDYLLKVFDYRPETTTFEEVTLENQIDRDRILADDNLKAEFKSWLLDPKNLREFDRGTVLIPEKFLARAAIAPTPVGFAPSDLLPAYGMVGSESDKAPFSEGDIVDALKKAGESGAELQNIRSVAGFERRLNDMTCAGCHQTRGIGGFHFPGVDWMTAKPSNSTVVPASPHFFGDQVRRRDILAAFRDGKQPDFTRGFANRPQLRGSAELTGTEYEDGWGAHCYVQHAKASDNDRSFRGWSCAEGLACQPASPATRMGMCFVNGR